jgi:hypothetical protein
MYPILLDVRIHPVCNIEIVHTQSLVEHLPSRSAFEIYGVSSLNVVEVIRIVLVNECIGLCCKQCWVCCSSPWASE